jgi:TolB-like protein
MLDREMDAISTGANVPVRIDEAATEALLQRILNSRTFRRSKRLKGLLEYALAPDAQLGERAVAAEVFGRTDGFDPRVDPLVRVQFGRLRRRLIEYYKVEGKDDPIRISLPARGYQPRIETIGPIGGNGSTAPGGGTISFSAGKSGERGEASADLKPAARPDRSGGASRGGSHSIAVIPFANVTGESGNDVFCHGLTEELIKSLTGAADIDVVSRTSAFQFKDEPLDIRDVGKELGVELILEGSVRIEDARIRVIVELTSAEDGFVIWSDAFDHDGDGILEGQAAIAKAILDALQPRLATAA